MTAQELRKKALRLWQPILARLGDDRYLRWLKNDLDRLIKSAHQEGREEVIEAIQEQMGCEVRERLTL